MQRSHLMLAAALCLVAVAATAWARPLTPEDLNLIWRVQAPAVKPNSYVFVVPVQSWDRAKNKKTQNLWLCNAKASDPGNCTRLAATDFVTDFAPQWSPDGKTLFFLSTRGNTGLTQLWAVDDNGAAYQVTNYPVSVDTFKISPKATALAFSAFVYPTMSMDDTAAQDAKKAASPVSAQKWDRLFVRRWDQWWDGKYSHLFVVKLSKDGASGRWTVGAASTAVDTMLGLLGDCPSRPFGDQSEYDWAPDETSLAYTTQLGRDIAWSTDLNIWEYVRATKVATCISCSNLATDTTPVYSPDGRYIAYLAMTVPASESDTRHIRIWDKSTKNNRNVAQNWDRSPDLLQWSRDGKTLYATSEDSARLRFFAVTIATGEVKRFAGENYSSGLNVVPCVDNSALDCAIFSSSYFQHPAEIYMSYSADKALPLTRFTEPQIVGIDFTQTIEMFFSGANGDQVQAWLHQPYGLMPGKQFPLVLYVHGGPESPWENMFHYRWNPQAIAAHGYAVLAVNYHGSGSFGDNFTKSILLDWGGKPYQDNMIAVDTATARYDWINPKALGAMGASYGGYMINWINSQTTRFKCLICHDGLFDTASNWYQTDELYFPEREFGGLPTDPNAVYAKWSPSTYAHKMVTPELIIHGGQDMRISDMAALSVFNNLQRRGIDSIFIRFPEENHWVLRPENSIYWHQEVFAWLDKYLK